MASSSIFISFKQKSSISSDNIFNRAYLKAQLHIPVLPLLLLECLGIIAAVKFNWYIMFSKEVYCTTQLFSIYPKNFTALNIQHCSKCFYEAEEILLVGWFRLVSSGSYCFCISLVVVYMMLFTRRLFGVLSKLV